MSSLQEALKQDAWHRKTCSPFLPVNHLCSRQTLSQAEQLATTIEPPTLAGSNPLSSSVSMTHKQIPCKDTGSENRSWLVKSFLLLLREHFLLCLALCILSEQILVCESFFIAKSSKVANIENHHNCRHPLRQTKHVFFHSQLPRTHSNPKAGSKTYVCRRPIIQSCL